MSKVVDLSDYRPPVATFDIMLEVYADNTAAAQIRNAADMPPEAKRALADALEHVGRVLRVQAADEQPEHESNLVAEVKMYALGWVRVIDLGSAICSEQDVKWVSDRLDEARRSFAAMATEADGVCGE